MSEQLQIEFSEICENDQNNIQNFNFITVQNIPSFLQSNELITRQWLVSILSNSQQLLTINLNINEELNEKWNCNIFELLRFNNLLIITFQSTLGEHASKTFWKVTGREKFYSLYIDDDNTEDLVKFIQEFLIKEIKNGNSGLISKFDNKDEIHIQELGTKANTNILMIAAQENCPNIVEKLLTKEFDLDFENDDKENAIDLAWTTFKEGKNSTADSTILNLLKSNSKWPKKFNYNEASNDIQDFSDLCENLHKNVDNNNLKALEDKLKEHPTLIHIYNRNNKSLAAHAFENRKFNIADVLDREIIPGAHEKLNIESLAKSHILVLRSKTKIASNDHLYQFRWRCVKNAYTTLDEDNFCSLILQVAAQVESIKIFFDFKHDSVYYLDPMKKATTLGTTYSGGTMYIGAKQLLDDSTKHIVLSTLAHELCHLAVLVTYMNPNFDPFPMGESDEKLMYIDEVMVESRDKMAGNEIVTNAFGYADELIASELIVTVAEMLMYYHNDSEKINKVKEIFDKLFKYAKEVVEPELERAIPVIRKLGDSEINIKYDSLTNAMKKSISHMTINLQGVDTTFYELFGDDNSCLKLLTPENIRDILLNGNGIKISDICTLDLKYALIERNFMNRETYQNLKTSGIQDYNSKVANRSKSLMKIRENSSKSFILSDYAGTGKTTVFKDAAVKIKNHQKNYWVSFVNLRKFEKVFKDYEPKLRQLRSNDVMDILCQIIQIDDNQLTAFENKLFRQLFNRNQVVLFFDGVDEICPRHTELLMEIFKILKQFGGRNEFWISTRPHYADKIKNIFKFAPISFVLYTMEQKVQFITEILRKNGITDETEITNAVGQINVFIFFLNWEPGYFSDPDHPLIIEIITEIYVEKREIKLDPSSHYALYAAMIDKQKEKVGDKIPNVERDPFSSLSVWHAHQVLAILVIIGELYDNTLTFTQADGTIYRDGFFFELEKLAIIEKWRQERRSGRWTSDMIQRYGFVTVNLDKPTETRSCIDFSHRTYAEFFVAQYIIDFLFNNNFDQGEMIKIMWILQIVQGTQGLENVAKFIFSFAKTVAKNENRQFHPLVKMYFRKRIWETIIDKEALKYHSDPFIFFGKIVVCDDELTHKLWLLNPKHKQNSFEIIITNEDFRFLNLIIDTANFVFGENWHEIFNKSGIKLISDEEIEALRDEIVESWQDWRNEKNLLKFCDYLHKNFDANVQRTMHDKMVYAFHVTNEKVLIKIVKIMSEIYDREIFAKKCVDGMFITGTRVESIIYIYQLIEKLYAEDRNAIRRIFFVRAEDTLFYNAIYTQNLDLFLFMKDFYLKYQDFAKELQDIVMEIEISDIFKYAVASELYADFKSFFIEIFREDVTGFREKVLDYIGSDLYSLEDYFDNLEDFLDFIVFND